MTVSLDSLTKAKVLATIKLELTLNLDPVYYPKLDNIASNQLVNVDYNKHGELVYLMPSCLAADKKTKIVKLN